MNGITTLLFDLGGVVLTNGWDLNGRKAACQHFGLDFTKLESRHDSVFDEFEKGICTIDEYVKEVVFYENRDFEPQQFIQFMEERSSAHKGSLNILQKLADAKRYQLATLNNESYELNLIRIHQNNLEKYFSAFFSSGFLGTRKPESKIFQIALNVLQKKPSECLFIDDKLENVKAAQLMGINTIHLDDINKLEKYLLEKGIII